MKIFHKVRHEYTDRRDIYIFNKRIFSYYADKKDDVLWEPIEKYIHDVLKHTKPNSKKLIVIPSDPIDAYDKKGQEDLEHYYNPHGMFDFVFVISPAEHGISFRHGMHIIGVDKKGMYYKKALKLRQQLVQKQPNVYLPDLADTLNNIGMALFESGHYKKAEISYNKSYNIYKTLFQKDTDIFLPNLIHVMFNIGNLQYYHKKYFYAEKILNKAIDLFLKHSIVCTDFLNKIIAQTISCLGNVQACLQHYIIAEKSYKKAIEFYRILSKDTSEACSDFLAETLQNLEYVQKINNR